MLFQSGSKAVIQAERARGVRSVAIVVHRKSLRRDRQLSRQLMRPVPERIDGRPCQLSEQVVLFNERLKLFVDGMNYLLVQALHKLKRLYLCHDFQVVNLRLVAVFHLILLHLELLFHYLNYVFERETAPLIKYRHTPAASFLVLDYFFLLIRYHGEAFLGLFATVTSRFGAILLDCCLKLAHSGRLFLGSSWVSNGHGFVAVATLNSQIAHAYSIFDQILSQIGGFLVEATTAHTVLERRNLVAMSVHIRMGMPTMFSRLNIGCYLLQIVLRPVGQSVLLSW